VWPKGVTVVAAVVLAAPLYGCGGASPATTVTARSAAASTAAKPGTSTAPSASASRSAGSSKAAGTQFRQALTAFAACLQSNGVKLPSATGGQALSLKGGDTKSPEYRGALAKCRPVLLAALRSASRTRSGSSSPSPTTAGAGSVAPHARRRARLPAAKVPANVTAIMKRFTSCMRNSGVPAFPEPEGEGFYVQRAGIDTSTAQYKAAEGRCTNILRALDPPG
jgi:hypothetical protein